MDTYHVYIIYSIKLDRYYVGYTSDLTKRLNDHNSGISKYTSKANDWKVEWNKCFFSRNEAHKYELMIKKKKSRTFILYLIQSNPSTFNNAG